MDNIVSKSKYNFFRDQVQKKIKKYEHKQKRSRHWTYSLKLATLCTTAIVTALATYTAQYPESRVSFMIIGLSALSTLLLGLTSFWKVESHWQLNMVIGHKLKFLREQSRRFEVRDKDLSEEEFKILWDTYEAILKTSILHWESVKDNPNN